MRGPLTTPMFNPCSVFGVAGGRRNGVLLLVDGLLSGRDPEIAGDAHRLSNRKRRIFIRCQTLKNSDCVVTLGNKTGRPAPPGCVGQCGRRCRIFRNDTCFGGREQYRGDGEGAGQMAGSGWGLLHERFLTEECWEESDRRRSVGGELHTLWQLGTGDR